MHYPRWDHCHHKFHDKCCGNDYTLVLSWLEIEDRKRFDCPYWNSNIIIENEGFRTISETPISSPPVSFERTKDKDNKEKSDLQLF